MADMSNLPEFAKKIVAQDKDGVSLFSVSSVRPLYTALSETLTKLAQAEVKANEAEHWQNFFRTRMLADELTLSRIREHLSTGPKLPADPHLFKAGWHECADPIQAMLDGTEPATPAQSAEVTK